jgi:hypothetical protein
MIQELDIVLEHTLCACVEAWMLRASLNSSP